MKLENARILLTGAAGGLGSELARQLTAAGSSLLLAGRNAKRLEALRETLGTNAAVVAADLTSTEGVALTVRAAQAFNVNLLINNAGANSFGLLENQPWSSTAQVLAISLEAPIHLTQAPLSRLCRLFGGQGRAARLLPGPAPGTCRFTCLGRVYSAAYDRHAHEQARGQ